MKRTATARSAWLLVPGVVALAVLLAALGAPALAIGADDPTPSKPAVTPAVSPAVPAQPAPAPQAEKETDPTDTAPGMRAYIDPETGKIGVPSVLPALAPEEDAQLQAVQPPVETVLPDGSVMLELNGNCVDYLIIDLDANNQKTLRCVQDPKAALQTPPPAPQREDR